MPSPYSWTRIRIALVVFAILCLAACRQSVDLGAVRDLQSNADAAHSSYNSLSDDFYDSCVRRVEYSSVASSLEYYVTLYNGSHSERTRQSSTKLKPNTAEESHFASTSLSTTISELTSIEIADLPKNDLLALLKRTDFPSIVIGLAPSKRAALETLVKSKSNPQSPSQVCARELVAARQWRRANDVLVKYFDSLGSLAGAPRKGDTYALSSLASALTESAAMNKDEATAVGALGNTIVGQVFDSRRRNALADFIPQADVALGHAIDSLKKAAGTNYQFALRQESDELEAFLHDNFILARPGVDAFEVLQYGNSWTDKRKAIDARRSAAAAYASSLDKLRVAHKNLLEAIDKDDASSAYGVAKALYDEMKPDIDTIQKVFEVKK